MTCGSMNSRTIITATVGEASTRAELRRALQKILSPYIDEHGIQWEHHDVTTTDEAKTVKPHAILAAPSSATWSRSRHLHENGPRPLRDSSWPWGLPSLKGTDREKVEAENNELRLSLAVIERSLTRSPSTTWFFVFPEDRGKGSHGHPASAWQLKELRAWATMHNAVRGAINQCELAPSSSPRPLGFLKHAIEHGCLGDSPFVCRGWPSFSSSSTRHYIGPLPRRCSCKAPHVQWSTSFSSSSNAGPAILAHEQTAEWLAAQVLRPHLHHHSARSALLREGSRGDLTRIPNDDATTTTHGDASFAEAATHEPPDLSDADTDDTWPEPEDMDDNKKHYIDTELVNLLNLHEHFPDACAIQNFVSQAPPRTIRMMPERGGLQDVAGPSP